ncbi:MAG: DnaJ family molecular chaperone [Gemmatimonadota bacterium]|nr:J domain-containing protein [Chloroflexota bacterium]
MTTRRPLPPGERTGYDDVAYRDALRLLGLTPPVAEDDIHRAYRGRAKQIHPDRLPETEQAAATGRIQRLNAARDYTLHHFRWFDAYQAQVYRRRAMGELDLVGPWQEWLFLPVTAVYALALLLAVAPAVLGARLLGAQRRERWRERRGRGAQLAWRAWMFVGPHVVTLALFAFVSELAIRIWFGASFLVMVSADAATLATGATNTLRQHRAVTRLDALVRGS